MTAVTMAAVDPEPRRLGTVLNLTAAAAIKAGMVVGILGSDGVSSTVQEHVTGTTVAPLGVALYSAAAGSKVAIASVGSIVKVVGAVASSAIDAGTQIMGSGTTAGGVIAYADAADAQPFGELLTGIASASTPAGCQAYALIYGPMTVEKGS